MRIHAPSETLGYALCGRETDNTGGGAGMVDCKLCLKRLAFRAKGDPGPGAYAPGGAVANAIADIVRDDTEWLDPLMGGPEDYPNVTPLPSAITWGASAEVKRALRNYRDFGRLAAAFTPPEIVLILENLQWVNGYTLTPEGAAQIH